MVLRPLKKHEKKKKSLSWYKKKLWGVFAVWVKKRDRDICFTCDTRGLSGGNYHAGHFIKAFIGGIELYFNEKNVHGQCARCNIWLDGNQYEYGLRLGKRTANALRKIQQETKRKIWTREDYEKKIEYYTRKLEKQPNHLLEP